MADYASVREYWKNLNIASMSDLELALDNFKILFAYNSGKIENGEIDFHDTREIFENGKVLNYTGSPRTLFEQQNQKLCYDFLKRPIVRRNPITVELVKQIHGILTAGTYDEQWYVERGGRPGEFKKHDYVTVINEVGYQPEEVEQGVAELLEELDQLPDSADTMKAAAYFHAVFENIHPFADGNGRVGRTLLNYFLMTHREPPIIVYDEDKKRYYSALERYDTGEDIDDLVAFMKEETAKTWDKAVQRTKGDRPQPHKKLSDIER